MTAGTLKVTFAERQHPTIIRTKQGKDMPVKGTAWIDPTEGRVLKTNFQIVTDARIEPTYPTAEETTRLRTSVGSTVRSFSRNM